MLLWRTFDVDISIVLPAKVLIQVSPAVEVSRALAFIPGKHHSFGLADITSYANDPTVAAKHLNALGIQIAIDMITYRLT